MRVSSTAQQSPECVVGVHSLKVGDELRQRQGVAGPEELDAVLQTAVSLHRVEVEIVGVSSHLREAGMSGREGEMKKRECMGGGGLPLGLRLALVI